MDSNKDNPSDEQPKSALGKFFIPFRKKEEPATDEKAEEAAPTAAPATAEQAAADMVKEALADDPAAKEAAEAAARTPTKKDTTPTFDISIPPEIAEPAIPDTMYTTEPIASTTPIDIPEGGFSAASAAAIDLNEVKAAKQTGPAGKQPKYVQASFAQPRSHQDVAAPIATTTVSSKGGKSKNLLIIIILIVVVIAAAAVGYFFLMPPADTPPTGTNPPVAPPTEEVDELAELIADISTAFPDAKVVDLSSVAPIIDEELGLTITAKTSIINLGTAVVEAPNCVPAEGVECALIDYTLIGVYLSIENTSESSLISPSRALTVLSTAPYELTRPDLTDIEADYYDFRYAFFPRLTLLSNVNPGLSREGWLFFSIQSTPDTLASLSALNLDYTRAPIQGLEPLTLSLNLLGS